MQTAHRRIKSVPDVYYSPVGAITGFETGVGRTGFQVKMLIRDKEVSYDAIPDAYAVKNTEQFFPYPCLGEVLFNPQFNSEGILTHFVNVNNIAEPNNAIQTGLVLGMYAMFKKKLTAGAPKFREFIKIENDVVTLYDFDRRMKDGSIFHCVFGGSMPPPTDGAAFRLAPDTVVYKWDWSKAKVPFQRCTREQAKEWGFVTRFEVGTYEDFLGSVWGGFYSTRGDEGVCDLIKCFPNVPPGWV